jgi:hypothetical protein
MGVETEGDQKWTPERQLQQRLKPRLVDVGHVLSQLLVAQVHELDDEVALKTTTTNESSARLPDFSCVNIPKQETIYQITRKFTK